MTALSTDTHPAAEAARLDLLRRATPRERFALASALTQTVRFHAKRAIARARPELSPRERDLLFVELTYGVELANKLRQDLEARPA